MSTGHRCFIDGCYGCKFIQFDDMTQHFELEKTEYGNRKGSWLGLVFKIRWFFNVPKREKRKEGEKEVRNVARMKTDTRCDHVRDQSSYPVTPQSFRVCLIIKFVVRGKCKGRV